MISALQCMDRGSWIGNRIRYFHLSMNNSYDPYCYIGDFDDIKHGTDPHTNCIRTDTQNKNFSMMTRKDDGIKPINFQFSQSVVRKTTRRFSDNNYIRNFYSIIRR